MDNPPILIGVDDLANLSYLHEPAVLACAKAKKHVICTKPLGRNAKEAKRMLDAVEQAGIFGGYLVDLCYTPKFLKSIAREPNRLYSGFIKKNVTTPSFSI